MTRRNNLAKYACVSGDLANRMAIFLIESKKIGKFSDKSKRKLLFSFDHFNLH